ncbi:MAG: CPBP family intramembrane metalloprotease [Planctomycetaceae bacterium]|nr:CPBP family intramembrane metalloprotease [Planctomycetaceae bacterium]
MLLSGEAGGVQRFVYSLGKLFQFLIPLIWIFIIERYFLSCCVGSKSAAAATTSTTSTATSLSTAANNVYGGGGKFWIYYWVEGLIFGLVVFCGIFFLYYFWFGLDGGELGVGSVGRGVIVKKVLGFGLVDWRLFLLLGIFYSVIHSGLEEYYWRWFLFSGLRDICGVCNGIIISGLGFAAHHVILLQTFFGFNSLLCPLGSVAIFVGGIYWAWLYQRSGNIYAAWLGHGIIDAAIFSIGYIICFAG